MLLYMAAYHSTVVNNKEIKDFECTFLLLKEFKRVEIYVEFKIQAQMSLIKSNQHWKFIVE